VLVILYCSIILCVDIYYNFQSPQCMYTSEIFIQFLHYNMFRPLFGHHQVVSIQSHSTFPAIPPPLYWLMFTSGGRPYLQCRMPVIDIKTYKDKKFWEELIAYFPLYDTGHIENYASNISSIVACVFVTAVTFLPSCCLATIGDTHAHTEQRIS
jgi:hypothetical protein